VRLPSLRPQGAASLPSLRPKGEASGREPGRRSARPAPRRARALALAALLAGCGDDPPSPPPKAGGAKAEPGAPEAAAPAARPAGPAPAGAPGAAPPGLAPPPSPGREKLITEIRKRPFRSEELAASPPGNSDPFHNNLESFVTRPPPPDKGGSIMSCLLTKYNLEELKLAAIILGSGDMTASRVMLIDPTGVGHTIKRGDRLGKSCALVQRILSDRVLFEFTEDLGQGKKRMVVRAVELHPTESQDAAGRGPLPMPK
jgi:hypothetical protein